MKTKHFRLIAFTAMPVALLAITSCSSTSEPKGGVESSSSMETTKGVPGGTHVNTYKVSATVTAVDAINRHITLETADGKTRVIKAGPEVANFNQIQVGDRVNATLVEQLVVFLRRGEAQGGTAQDTGSRQTSVALAPTGSKPGIVMADTIETTAKVVGLDKKNQQASLQFPDGTVHTVKVRSDVDLSKAQLGDDVVIRSTEDMAIKVEKP